VVLSRRNTTSMTWVNASPCVVGEAGVVIVEHR